MLKNTTLNRKATIKVAKALGELNRKVVFVGGAMVSLYIDDPAAEDWDTIKYRRKPYLTGLAVPLGPGIRRRPRPFLRMIP